MRWRSARSTGIWWQEKLYRTEYKYFDANYSATLLNKVIGDLGEITSFLETVLPDMIASLIGIFTYAVYIGETNLGLLMVILITYPLIFWIAGKLVKRIRGLQANYRQKTDVMAQIAQDAVSGILVLRSFGIEGCLPQENAPGFGGTGGERGKAYPDHQYRYCGTKADSVASHIISASTPCGWSAAERSVWADWWRLF